MECFNCGAVVNTLETNCPNCGYRFTAGDDRNCPNKKGPVCSITENICTEGIYFMTCPIKEQAEKESSF